MKLLTDIALAVVGVVALTGLMYLAIVYLADGKEGISALPWLWTGGKFK